MPSFFFKTFGCQMNVADNEDITRQLINSGYTETENEAEADLIFINTCVVRQRAEDKAYSYLGTLRQYKTKFKPYIILMGCIVPKCREDLQRSFPFINAFLDRSNPKLIIEHLVENGLLNIGDQQFEIRIQPTRTNAFVTAMRGCNNYCSYCIVPYVRGNEESEPQDIVISQVQQRIKEGFVAVTLLGQSVLSYKYEDWDFPRLLKACSEIDGVKRINFITSHPKDISQDFIDRIYSLPNINHYLHLPIQSGNNRMLELMRRKYTVEHYSKMIEYLRVVVPDIYISTDIIVGFPSETVDEYKETLDFLTRMKFNDVYMYKYSPREGTQSAKMQELISPEEKHQRLVNLVQHQHEISARVNRIYIGKVYEVMVEEHNLNKGITLVSLPINKVLALPLKSDLEIGSIQKAKITDVRISRFIGEWFS